MPAIADVRRTRRVTQLLRAWSAGDDGALEEVYPFVYDELRRMARRFLAAERRGHTLQPTALVHEAYLRLVELRAIEWRERAQFYCIAARTMRRILVDYARYRGSLKRGADRLHLPIEAAFELPAQPTPDLVQLDRALTALAEMDPLKASIVDLRFFGGMSLEETADALGCSRPTVVRHWAMARAWLYAEMVDGTAGAR